MCHKIGLPHRCRREAWARSRWPPAAECPCHPRRLPRKCLPCPRLPLRANAPSAWVGGTSCHTATTQANRGTYFLPAEQIRSTPVYIGQILGVFSQGARGARAKTEVSRLKLVEVDRLSVCIIMPITSGWTSFARRLRARSTRLLTISSNCSSFAARLADLGLSRGRLCLSVLRLPPEVGAFRGRSVGFCCATGSPC